MRKMLSKLGILVFGTLIVGISGCSMFSPSNAPVDCDAVKNQQQAGFSDAKIASILAPQSIRLQHATALRPPRGPRINRNYLGVEPA